MGSGGANLYMGPAIGAAAAGFQSATDVLQMFTKNDHFEESLAEIQDNITGQQVAEAMRDAYNSSKSKEQAMADLKKIDGAAM